MSAHRRLTVMTFNIRGFSRRRDGANSWEHRAALNVRTIRRHAPDVLGVQELRTESLATYRRELPGYACLLGPAAGNGAPGEFTAILYDPARLELLGTGGFWLSETPDRRSASWRTRVVRAANWARFRTPQGLSFLHLNTHLDHLSGLARVRGGELVLRRVAALRADGDLPVVVTGDFNCRPGSVPYRLFTDDGFQDTAVAAGSGRDTGPGTFHAFHGARRVLLDTLDSVRRARAPRRLDWILLAGGRARLRAVGHTVLRDRDPATGTYPSDHYPVLAALTAGG